MLDLDDARTESGQEERRKRAGEGQRQVEDRQAGERPFFA